MTRMEMGSWVYCNGNLPLEYNVNIDQRVVELISEAAHRVDGDKDAYDGDLLWSLMWGIWTYYRGGCHARELFHETRRPYVRANINHILSHCDVLKSNGISFDAPQFISPGPDLSIRQENLGGEVE